MVNVCKRSTVFCEGEVVGTSDVYPDGQSDHRAKEFHLKGGTDRLLGLGADPVGSDTASLQTGQS